MAFPYEYEYPLPKVPEAPVPSKANYDAHNAAWLIEFFARILSQDHSSVRLKYENNTKKENNEIFIVHPLDGFYLGDKTECVPKSPEQARYELFAKNSKRLQSFMDRSPANIEYFVDTCVPTGTGGSPVPPSGGGSGEISSATIGLATDGGPGSVDSSNANGGSYWINNTGHQVLIYGDPIVGITTLFDSGGIRTKHNAFFLFKDADNPIPAGATIVTARIINMIHGFYPPTYSKDPIPARIKLRHLPTYGIYDDRTTTATTSWTIPIDPYVSSTPNFASVLQEYVADSRYLGYDEGYINVTIESLQDYTDVEHYATWYRSTFQTNIQPQLYVEWQV